MSSLSRSYRTGWDALVAVAAVLTAVEIPARLVFATQPTGIFASSTWLVTILFAADFVVRWRTRGSPSDETERQGSRIAEPYPWYWVLIDLAAAVPFAALPVAPAWRLLLLLKLGRVAQRLRRWRRADAHGTIRKRLASFLLWLVLLAHWSACGWLALRGLPPEVDATTSYVRALYWWLTTATTVGYGDITPNTNAETLYAMLVMVIGVAVYGFLIGSVAGQLANLNPARVRHRELVERVTAFMRYRQVPIDLQRRILAYYGHLWQMRLGYDESAAISALPPTLRTEVALFLNRDIIQKVPLFREASQELIEDIASEMRPTLFVPGDYIMKAGEQGDEMYFISHGRAQVLGPDGETVIGVLTTGDFFGELALLQSIPRTATIRAVDYCDMYALERETFNRILDRHSKTAEHFRKIAERHRRQDRERESPG